VGLHEARTQADAPTGQRRDRPQLLARRPGWPPRTRRYHASKHGVIGLTKSAALEYAPLGIRINAICPGTIETPMVAEMIAGGELDMDDAIANQPIARLGQASDMAAAILWFCSPDASVVLGVALPVDGGYTAR
jgi:NAD(P)-dependent dehydrogenase (short-subunit alcohol dehydrogenase family)